jgi:isocitrate lyase
MQASLERETTELERETIETSAWLSSPRFDGIVRLHTARQVVEQRGTIRTDYVVAKLAAEQFYARLRELFDARRSMTTFGPYSTGQALTMKRHGIEGIYLGGWATSAKGSMTEDPGADLASYPLSQVPDEAAAIVRALLAADRNQRFARSRVAATAASKPAVDYRPFIIADADTGHGGDAHVRNLIRRFVEAGVPGYHIEDQKPGVKKCGHQGGKVLVAQNEQILRLNAARLQLDIMGVSGLIVARTDAEAATLLESNGDERDQPFILGTTCTDVPSYKAVVLAIHRTFFEAGISSVRGHFMFALAESEFVAAQEWLRRTGMITSIDESAAALTTFDEQSVERTLDDISSRCIERWRTEAGVTTYRQAVANVMADRLSEGDPVELTIAEWLAFSSRASFGDAREKAASLGIRVEWDAERARTPEGYYQVQGGLEYAIAKSLSAAPFADLLWMETNTANLAEAKAYGDAIHATFPSKMLAYNLSPSFNWDTTGMSDEEMRAFPTELGKLGFVFNFITYGGHQIDGLAAEEFSAALQADGMLALARLQRRLRVLDSPYRTPQTLAGAARLDAALMATSGRTATTKAMGGGSTHHQHLREIEPSVTLLEQWLQDAAGTVGTARSIRVELMPVTGTSHEFDLQLFDNIGQARANVVFGTIQHRGGGIVLSVCEQQVVGGSLAAEQLTLAYQFLLHRFKPVAMQFLHPTEAEWAQMIKLERSGLVHSVSGHVGRILVGDVDRSRVTLLSQIVHTASKGDRTKLAE